MTVPRTILRHRVVRDSEAERLLETAWRREVDRFMGGPRHADSPRLARRGSSSGYSKSMGYARDDLIRQACAAPGYLGPEPDVRDRVARLPPTVAGHLAPGMSPATALESAGIPDAFRALGAVLDATREPTPSAVYIAVEILEFGVSGARLRAMERP